MNAVRGTTFENTGRHRDVAGNGPSIVPCVQNVHSLQNSVVFEFTAIKEPVFRITKIGAFSDWYYCNSSKYKLNVQVG